MIVIFGIKDKLNPIKAQLSDVIHSCMESVLGMPEDKRAHRFIPMDKEDFYYPGGRSDAYTVIEINMMAGRKIEAQLPNCLSQFKKEHFENHFLECFSGYVRWFFVSEAATKTKAFNYI